MIARDQLLDILNRLPVRYWPVFFWDLVWLTLFHENTWSETGGFMSFAITKTGRIHILGVFVNDAPDDTDWTRHAPREPWAALDPEVIAAAIEALDGEGLVCTVSVPLLACFWTVEAPAILNSS